MKKAAMPATPKVPAYRSDTESSHERVGSSVNGLAMLLAIVILAGLIVHALYTARPFLNNALGFVVPTFLVIVFISKGFFMLQPNEAAALTFFGDYAGTDRTPGLRWTWPWLAKHRVSVRARNNAIATLKVNDKRGNPIEIAAVVVWRVEDTAQALFDVEDFENFVRVQSESALRHVATGYNYDDGDEHVEGEVTLRAGAEQVAAALRSELQERVALAGVRVEEAKLTHLAYAAEIAGAMLRRQQAEAVIAARAKIVNGAVSMVEMALKKLAEENVVELDQKTKAQMVCNLMVVLCSESDAQPVINAGSSGD